MNINSLEYFVTVAECGSINKAAKKLFMSQPHLSNIIKDLNLVPELIYLNGPIKG